MTGVSALSRAWDVGKESLCSWQGQLWSPHTKQCVGDMATALLPLLAVVRAPCMDPAVRTAGFIIRVIIRVYN